MRQHNILHAHKQIDHTGGFDPLSDMDHNILSAPPMRAENIMATNRPNILQAQNVLQKKENSIDVI